MVTPEGNGTCHAKQEDGMPYKSCYYRKIDGDFLTVIEK